MKPVFEGETKRFEIAYHDELYEHFTSPIFDEEGRVIEIIGIANNITDRKLQEEEARYFASHDHLTDLTNRRSYEKQVQEKINKSPDDSYAMMIIDLDNFKSVNDNYGHLAGDRVLKEAAKRIDNIIKAHSAAAVVARMGGDEFSAFILYTKLQDVIDIAGEVTAYMLQPYTLPRDKISLSLSASIGIALYRSDSSFYGQLLHYADMAMYQAKKAEGGSYRFYSATMIAE